MWRNSKFHLMMNDSQQFVKLSAEIFATLRWLFRNEFFLLQLLSRFTNEWFISLHRFFFDVIFWEFATNRQHRNTPSVLAEPTNEKSKASGILVRVIQCCFLFCFELEFELLSVALGIPIRKVGNGFLLIPAGIYFRNAARQEKFQSSFRKDSSDCSFLFWFFVFGINSSVEFLYTIWDRMIIVVP